MQLTISKFRFGRTGLFLFINLLIAVFLVWADEGYYSFAVFLRLEAVLFTLIMALCFSTISVLLYRLFSYSAPGSDETFRTISALLFTIPSIFLFFALIRTLVMWLT